MIIRDYITRYAPTNQSIDNSNRVLLEWVVQQVARGENYGTDGASILIWATVISAGLYGYEANQTIRLMRKAGRTLGTGGKFEAYTAIMRVVRMFAGGHGVSYAAAGVLGYVAIESDYEVDDRLWLLEMALQILLEVMNCDEPVRLYCVFRAMQALYKTQKYGVTQENREVMQTVLGVCAEEHWTDIDTLRIGTTLIELGGSAKK